MLDGYGSVSRKQAEEKAFSEYEKFNKKQNIESDFDQQIEALEKKVTKSLIPNAKTTAAMKEARKGKLNSYNGVKKMMGELQDEND